MRVFYINRFITGRVTGFDKPFVWTRDYDRNYTKSVRMSIEKEDYISSVEVLEKAND